MNQHGPDRYREWDAAYVLGSLVPEERHEFEQHLAGCARCRASVAELAALPGLLAALTPEEARASAPEVAEAPNLVAGLAAKLRRRRRRTRLAIAGVALACSAASVGVTLAVSPPPSSSTVQVQPVAARLDFHQTVPGRMSAQGTLTALPWGTRVDWTCRYAAAYPSPAVPGASAAAPGTAAVADYGLVIIDAGGAATQIASWSAGPGSVATPTATTSIAVAKIRRVEIRSLRTGTVLLTAEPQS